MRHTAFKISHLSVTGLESQSDVIACIWENNKIENISLNISVNRWVNEDVLTGQQWRLKWRFAKGLITKLAATQEDPFLQKDWQQ
jgi:hypothetical protein